MKSIKKVLYFIFQWTIGLAVGIMCFLWLMLSDVVTKRSDGTPRFNSKS